MKPQIAELLGTILFVTAIVHTFATPWFERRAHHSPRHSGLWHLAAEVEVVFGLWACVLVAVLYPLVGERFTIDFLESHDFTEPLFIFVIMVISATRPILQVAARLVDQATRALPARPGVAFYFVVMTLVPLLGSFITEPAAMTLAALILRDRLFSKPVSERLKYATLGLLFVNISIGGTLSPFAAPPVLMVAGKWNWDMAFMLSTFGWKTALAVVTNATIATLLFRRELGGLPEDASATTDTPVPWPLTVVHLALLTGVVVLTHHPVAFCGLFLLFLAIAQAYARHQDRLILREALLVASFLAGLVILGSLQRWWLQPVLMAMSQDAIFFGALGLTALTDNAALTYLGSLVDGLSPEYQYALVAGAVTGGGLTVIANAPNPAGIAILRGQFAGETVRPLGLVLAALGPTLVAIVAFRLL